jgi:predicted amidohydrolase
MQDLKITIIQSVLHWGDKAANLKLFSSYIDSIREETDLIILPEMFSTGFMVAPEEYAEPDKGDAFRWMQEQSAKKGCVVTGSLIIREDNNYYNRLYWVRPDGSHDFYDKRHLFRMGGEHTSYHYGRHKLVTTLKGWRICPLVCYDLRFPVWSKNRYLGGEYEYDMLIYVANWPMVRNHVWKTLLAARAIENIAYVAGVNRIGKDGNDIDHSGDSVVLNPKGQPLVKIPTGKQVIETVEINASQLREIREKFPVGMDWDSFKIDQD